jgi:hypothetical protein
MMRPLEIHIEQLVVEMPAERAREEELRGVLDAALRQLATRLERAPFLSNWTNDLVLDSLALDALSPETLLGARGAEQLADALYQAITRRKSR